MIKNSISENCIFCQHSVVSQESEGKYFWVKQDKYPITIGHTLLIPKRHIVLYKDMTDSEVIESHHLLCEQMKKLEILHLAKGFNIGINDGEAAGQTVQHLHIHLIPRYPGDCNDPRGGIRWIFPDRAKYWDE